MANLDHYSHRRDRNRFGYPERVRMPAPEERMEIDYEALEKMLRQGFDFDGLYPGNPFRSEIPTPAKDFIETRSAERYHGEPIELIDRDYSGKCHHCGNPDVIQGFELKLEQVGYKTFMRKTIGFCQDHYQDTRGIDFKDKCWNVEREIC